VAGRFSARAWEETFRRVVTRAFHEVPFYREQWAVAGRVLPEPEPVQSRELIDQLFRLCPLSRPFRPAREPSLWTGELRGLRAAAQLTTGAPRGTLLLEVREAMLDRRMGGPRYGVVLPPGARTAGEGRRCALNRIAATLAARAGRALVVGSPQELAEVLPELRAAAGRPAGLELIGVPRMTLGQAVRERQAPMLAHDPCLGYVAARVPTCGRIHLLWREFHARADGGAVTVTALRRRRPTLVNVIPADSTRLTRRICPEHRSPVIEEQDQVRE
jgi:hypothetical protein